METQTLDQTTDSSIGGSELNNQRPGMLKILCRLTYIGSGIGVLASLLMTFMAHALSQWVQLIPGLSSLVGGGVAYSIVSLLLSAATLYAAIQMWNLKKLGFFIYIGAQVVAILLPIVWLGAEFGWMSVLITGTFITLYGLNLKHME